ncbi:hypothetical protein PHISCL_08014 [Aspergillus sclerotialis]|uniref:Uncharacterized protein n=1 Tax=Aspergillus sclerotialis TaxID=2070753 RepID=A0A3A2Z955_9EURO|nr:hypothetical protein PHISCL_08014 [Aspergillus sclerotialis]
MQSMSPISTDTSTCHDPPHPMISLDFFEFDFGDMNPSASGESEQDRDGKVDGSLGSPAGKRGGSNGFGIAVDPEEELGGRENYDFLDAFLVSN